MSRGAFAEMHWSCRNHFSPYRTLVIVIPEALAKICSGRACRKILRFGLPGMAWFQAKESGFHGSSLAEWGGRVFRQEFRFSFFPPFHFFFQVRPHHLRIVFTNATSRQVLLAARKNNSLRLKLFPMNIASAKSKRTGTKALCVHNAMAGRDRVAGIFVEGVTHIAAQIAVSYQSGNL